MKHPSRPHFQPRLETLEDRCTPSTMPNFLHAWDGGHAVAPPHVAPALSALFNPPSTQAIASAFAAHEADARFVPFKITGGGTVPQGLPIFPYGTAPHNATGTATELGRYTGEGQFQMLTIDPNTLTGTFKGSFVFTAANGDRLAFNYGAGDNPGHFALTPVGNGKFVAEFVAQFTPDPQLSTGRFADVIGGSFTMVATSEPFALSSGVPGFTAPFAYSWVGEGSLEFSTGK